MSFPSTVRRIERAGPWICAAALCACAVQPPPSSDDGPGSVRLSPDVHVPLAPAVLRPGEAVPARRFDLARWKLTIPSGEDIQVDELNAGYSLPGAFYIDPETGGMVFRVPNRAGTTENSTYSRTELREMRLPTESAKADANNWTMEQGGTLKARLRVDAVSTTGDPDKVGRIVIGQIHGPDSEVIRLYYRKKPDEPKGRIYAGLDSVDNDNTYSPDIVGNANGAGIALGEVFAYQIRLRGEQLSVIVEPESGPASLYTVSIDPAYAGLNLYFKAGVYNQNNTGDAGDYAQATFFALETSHP